MLKRMMENPYIIIIKGHRIHLLMMEEKEDKFYPKKIIVVLLLIKNMILVKQVIPATEV